MPHAVSKTTMEATVQRLGNVAVVHLTGRLVRGEGCAHLREIVLGQGDAEMIVMNLAGVDRIDAWGLGGLLRLQEWASAQRITFKLMNTVDQVERVFRITKLDRVFNFCSVRELFCLMHRAADASVQTAVA